MAMINLLMLQRPFCGEVCWTNTWRNIKGVFEKTADLHLLCVRGVHKHVWVTLDVKLTFRGGGEKEIGMRRYDLTILVLHVF